MEGVISGFFTQVSHKTAEFTANYLPNEVYSKIENLAPQLFRNQLLVALGSGIALSAISLGLVLKIRDAYNSYFASQWHEDVNLSKQLEGVLNQIKIIGEASEIEKCKGALKYLIENLTDNKFLHLSKLHKFWVLSNDKCYGPVIVSALNAEQIAFLVNKVDKKYEGYLKILVSYLNREDPYLNDKLDALAESGKNLIDLDKFKIFTHRNKKFQQAWKKASLPTSKTTPNTVNSDRRGIALSGIIACGFGACFFERDQWAPYGCGVILGIGLLVKMRNAWNATSTKKPDTPPLELLTKEKRLKLNNQLMQFKTHGRDGKQLKAQFREFIRNLDNKELLCFSKSDKFWNKIAQVDTQINYCSDAALAFSPEQLLLLIQNMDDSRMAQLDIMLKRLSIDDPKIMEKLEAVAKAPTSSVYADNYLKDFALQLKEERLLKFLESEVELIDDPNQKERLSKIFGFFDRNQIEALSKQDLFWKIAPIFQYNNPFSPSAYSGELKILFEDLVINKSIISINSFFDPAIKINWPERIDDSGIDNLINKLRLKEESSLEYLEKLDDESLERFVKSLGSGDPLIDYLNLEKTLLVSEIGINRRGYRLKTVFAGFNEQQIKVCANLSAFWEIISNHVDKMPAYIALGLPVQNMDTLLQHTKLTDNVLIALNKFVDGFPVDGVSQKEREDLLAKISAISKGVKSKLTWELEKESKKLEDVITRKRQFLTTRIPTHK